jgi:hypothetical protein
VLLSGLEGNVFAASVQAIGTEAETRGIPCYPVPFFSSMNGPKFFREDILRRSKPHMRDRHMALRLTEPCIATARRIISDFLDVPIVR